MTEPRRIAATIQIDAPPAAVWEVVSDVRRMAEFSPELRRIWVLGRKSGTWARGAVGHDAELADGIRTTMERMKARIER
jgi:uncharacterized protein YndB with AHSA1/START domain